MGQGKFPLCFTTKSSPEICKVSTQISGDMKRAHLVTLFILCVQLSAVLWHKEITLAVCIGAPYFVKMLVPHTAQQKMCLQISKQLITAMPQIRSQDVVVSFNDKNIAVIILFSFIETDAMFMRQKKLCLR